MRMLMFWLLGFLALALTGLLVWRGLDHVADRTETSRLLALQPGDPPRFAVEMVEGIPEPARRFFTYAIAEGTPLNTVSQIEMTGQFALGDKSAPNHVPMTATQVIAAPDGFIWIMRGGRGALRMSGSDSGQWTRFWLAGSFPVARFGGTPDHARSAFGRLVSEAVFWAPAAVLPGPNVTWEPVSENVARMTMRSGGLEQTVDVTVDAQGHLVQVTLPRWTNANADKEYRLQPFGGYASEFRDFGGLRLPTHVEGGNLFGTEDYFPFFIADVSEIRFPTSGR